MKKDVITVILKVTNGCNLRCPYCYNYSKLGEPEKLSIENFEAIIFKLVKEYKNITLIFHGGEPTLMGLEWYEKAFKIIELYKQQFEVNFNLGLQTNFVIQDDKLLDLLFSKNVGIGTSFDGIQNDTTRKKTKEYLNNVEKYKDEKISCINILTKENNLEILKNLKYLEDTNLNSIKFNRVYKTKTMIKDLDNLDSETLIEFYYNLFLYCYNKEETIFDVNFSDYLKMISLKEENLNKLTCEYNNCLNKWIAIQPNGDCYQCGQEWEQNEEYKFGNILKVEKIEEIYNSDSYLNFKNLVIKSKENCKESCEIYQFCKGYCPAKRLAQNDSILINDEINCDFLKGILKKLYNFIQNNEIKNKNFKRWL